MVTRLKQRPLSRPLRCWTGVGTGVAIALLGLLLSSCGPSKMIQCRQILAALQEAEEKRIPGNSSRIAYRANAQLYDTLANELIAMDIRSAALQEHQIQLVEAYRGKVAAMNLYLETSHASEDFSRPGSTRPTLTTVNAVMTEQMRADNDVTLAIDLFYNTCSN